MVVEASSEARLGVPQVESPAVMVVRGWMMSAEESIGRGVKRHWEPGENRPRSLAAISGIVSRTARRQCLSDGRSA